MYRESAMKLFVKYAIPQIIGLLFNSVYVIVDGVFIGKRLGSAALATAAGPLISVGILLPHFLGKKGYLYFQKLKTDTDLFRLFVRLGLPSFVMEFSIGMVTFLMNYGIVRYGYGEEGLAAYLIIGYMMLMILTLFLGMAEGLQPVFSYLHAAGDRQKLKKLLHISILIFLCTGIVSYVFVCRYSLHFYRVFTPQDEALAVFAARVSKSYFSGFFCAGVNILMISYWQSVSSSAKALFLSSLRGFLLSGLMILFLPAYAGSSYLWICHSAAEACPVVICLLMIVRKFSFPQVGK